MCECLRFCFRGVGLRLGNSSLLICAHLASLSFFSDGVFGFSENVFASREKA